MPVEIAITLKDEERTLRKDFLIYETITLDPHDPILDKCIHEAIEEFKGAADSIKIRALMILLM